MNQQIICFFDALPTLISIHRIVTSNDRCYLSIIGSAASLQFFDKSCSGLGVNIAAIGKGVDKNIGNFGKIGSANQSFDVVNMSMYATVRDQTEKMKFNLVFLGSFESFLQYGLVFKRILINSHIDFGKVLIDHSSSAQVYMSNLTVSHLSVWKPNIHTISTQSGMWVFSVKRIDKRRMRLVNRRYRRVWRDSPAVQNHQ